MYQNMYEKDLIQSKAEKMAVREEQGREGALTV